MTLDSPGTQLPRPPRRERARGRASASRPPAPAGPGQHMTGAGPLHAVIEWRASGRLGALVLLVLVVGGCVGVVYLGLISQPPVP